MEKDKHIKTGWQCLKKLSVILGMLPRGLGVRNLIFQTEGVVSSDELMVTGITNNLEQKEVECV